MAAKPNEDKASVWKQRFENRKMKLTALFEDAQKYYDIMYAVQNTKKMAPWKSKVYLPILASKAWDLLARMSDVVPLFNVTIKGELDLDDVSGNFTIPEEVRQRERRIEAKLHEEYVSCEQPMKLRVFDPLVDAIVAGTGYACVPWEVETKQSKARPFDELGEMDNESEITKTSEEGHNEFYGVNFFDVFPAEADNWWRMPYLIVRGQKTKIDMEDSGLYQNLDNCNTDPTLDVTRETYNQSRNRVVNEYNPVDPDDTVEMITYYECYERTAKGIELTVYAEGAADNPDGEGNWVLIRPTSVPYWHDYYPVVPFYTRRKSYSVFGESLFENNRSLQSATNDLFNHYLDNWNLSIESMIMYEDGTMTNDFVIEPGGEITFTGDEPKPFKFPEPNPQQLSVVMDVVEKGVDAATFSPYATGNPNDGNDKTQGTAYGVKTIAEAATTKIGFFRDNFKQSMKIVGRIWLSNLQQFADDPQEIRRIQDGRTVPDIIVPSDYQGDIDLDIDDESMTPVSRQDLRDQHDQLIQDLIAIQNQAITQAGVFKTPSDIPRYNWNSILEESAQLKSIQDFDRFLLDSNVQIPQDTSQQKDPKELLSFSYKDAPPDIQSQIEEMYGFQPSAMHDSTMTHQAIQMGAEQAKIEHPTNYGAENGNRPGYPTGNPPTGAAAPGSGSGQ